MGEQRVEEGQQRVHPIQRGPTAAPREGEIVLLRYDQVVKGRKVGARGVPLAPPDSIQGDRAGKSCQVEAESVGGLSQGICTRCLGMIAQGA